MARPGHAKARPGHIKARPSLAKARPGHAKARPSHAKASSSCRMELGGMIFRGCMDELGGGAGEMLSEG